MDHNNKLSPISPPAGYPTSDLGSSPRSSISISHSAIGSTLGPNWTSFRDYSGGAKSRSSDYGDDNSDVGYCCGGKDFLSPHQILSPAPFSPFSDCGGPTCSTSLSATPYSSRSPNLSPLPMRANNLHFSFEQLRSRSSMSSHRTSEEKPEGGNTLSGQSGGERREQEAMAVHLGMMPRSLGLESRERSRSEGQMMVTKKSPAEEEEDEEMDTTANLSTFSVPLKISRAARNTENGNNSRRHRHYTKKRLLEKYSNASEHNNRIVTPPPSLSGTTPSASARQASKNNSSQDSVDIGVSASAQVSRQPTIEEPPPSPTFAELFHSRDLGSERQTQVEEWIRQQSVALEVFRNSLIPLHQEANLLQVPNTCHPLVPQTSIEQHLANPFAKLLSQSPLPSHQQSASPGPIKPATLWRRSRSESDVSSAISTTSSSISTTTTISTAAPTTMPVAINDASSCICEHCGQGFAMHDRLAKHIASRHRDRSASMNDENTKIYKCNLCTKSFGRSDMLTRHIRLHSGIKPYCCTLCGQVFSRSDHLSTHQRTHTGEKPYRCPYCQYSASRRDMITRHMRTHLGADGQPIPFSFGGAGEHTLLIPPLGELSLASQNPTPEPQQDHHHQFNKPPTSGSVSPAVRGTRRRHSPPPFPNTEAQPAAETTFGLLAGPTNLDIAAAAARILSAANANSQFPLSPQMMLSTLGQVPPPQLRRSTPNLLGAGWEHPSAFHPPTEQQQQLMLLQQQQFNTNTTNEFAAAAAAAMSQLLAASSSLNQQQPSQPPPTLFPPLNLSQPIGGEFGSKMGSGRISPLLRLRQNSIGGYGFSDNTNESSSSNTNNMGAENQVNHS